MATLENKNAIITGAASGIGRASALAFAQAGAKLVLADINPLDDVVAQIEEAGGQAVGISGDASDEGHVQELVETCCQRYGGLHVFFANAGMAGDFFPILDETRESWQRVLEVNLIGPFLAVKYGGAKIAEAGGGSIVLTASVAALRAAAGPAAYSASKAGVVSLAQVAASQLGDQGVRVNAICPGLIETGMTAPLFEYAKAAGREDRIGRYCPMQRAGQPEEIARVVLHLASDDASYLTGQAIAIDGGLCATHPFSPKSGS
ncbi:MAG: SDR family NAD(P)-dependent oxidoreductase [Myxococcales bacterium]|nr:SDR family NAD(P)-dependent oxidoreductase [Myxococcales bacterium]